MNLEGKVALITGASEGIGAATAEAFRRRGARLALAARSSEKLERVGGGDALILPGDLTAEDARRRAVAGAMERYGRIDILVNNAGRGQYAPSHTADLGQARVMFELNFFAAVAMAQLAAAHMKAQGSGCIVNVSSIAGKMPLPWFTLYSASKYALGAFSDGLRIELRQHGVQVVTVCPGYVKTGFQEHVIEGQPPRSIREAKQFAITAEECAEAIARGVERGKRTVVAPVSGWLLIAAMRLFPGFSSRRLEKMMRDLEREGAVTGS